eukprot:scaffold93687_cov78-Phaeocystis_antarctica.AAC.7
MGRQAEARRALHEVVHHDGILAEYVHPDLVAVAELGLEPHLEPVGPGPARVAMRRWRVRATPGGDGCS